MQECTPGHCDITVGCGATVRDGRLETFNREGGKTLAFQPGVNLLFMEDMDWKALHT